MNSPGLIHPVKSTGRAAYPPPQPSASLSRRNFARGTKNLAATYSRGVYKTTTIGKTAFDGRVRNGNGSGRSFMATKKCFKRTWPAPVGEVGRCLSENCTQARRPVYGRITYSRVEIAFSFLRLKGERGKSDQAARPISISPLNPLLGLHA